jgi:predicted ATPase/DNA-binding SARP family transcriptional activator
MRIRIGPFDVIVEGVVPLFVRLLGQIVVGEDHSSLSAPPGLVAAAVLVHLALARGRVVTPESLINAVWDVGPETARNAVQVGVLKLRRQLGVGILEGTRAGYRLRTDMLRVDWFDAELLLAQARHDVEAGRFGAALEATAAAQALFQGEPLIGLSSNASETCRHAARELRTSVLTCRAQALLGLGQAEESIESLKAESIRDPMSEPVHVLLMKAYAMSGRQAEALAVYEGLRTRLRDELGISPSGPAQELFAEVLNGYPSTARAPVPTLSRPAPVLSLPAPGTPLIGRDQEVDEVVGLVAGGNRMVTLLGPGGIGKTRLAIEAARRIATDQERPVVFVDLTAAESYGDIIPTIAHSLEVDPESLMAEIEGTRILLVLDNAEHVLAGVADASSLLLAVTGVDLILTSRSPLRLQEERTFDVDGLLVDGPLSPALQLLADRVGYGAAVAVGFRRDLEVLVRAVDGVPLVLELLSSALRWQTPAQVLENLKSTLTALADDASRNREPRHSSIAAAVGWSVGNADDSTRRALSALSIIRGSFSEQAAAAVVNATGSEKPARGILAALIDLSLVKRLHQPGEVRFRILEPIRLYSDEGYAEWAMDAEVRMAYSRHYLSKLAAAHDRFGISSNGFDDMVRMEEGNLKQSLAWSWEYEPNVAVHYMPPLLFGLYRADVPEFILAWSTRVMDSHHGAASERNRVMLMRLLYLSDASHADLDELDRLSEAVAPDADSLDDDWHCRWIQTQINRECRRGDLEAALTWTGQFRVASDSGRNAFHTQRACIFGSLGRWKEAEEVQISALGDWSVDQHRDAVMYRLSSLGYVALVQGNIQASENYLAQAADLAAQGVTPSSLKFVEINVAWLELASGKPEDALNQVASALSKSSALRDRTSLAEALTIAGLAFLNLGRIKEAGLTATAEVLHADDALGLADPYLKSAIQRLLKGCEESGTGARIDAASLVDLMQLIQDASTSS